MTNSPGPSQAADVDRGFIGALNRRGLDAAERFVEKFIGWQEANVSLRRVWSGVPDLRVELHDVMVEDFTAVRQGSAS
ncbi:MAG: hypothetical protein ABSB70_24135 [Candidatus Velthaea sp.]